MYESRRAPPSTFQGPLQSEPREGISNFALLPPMLGVAAPRGSDTSYSPPARLWIGGVTRATSSKLALDDWNSEYVVEDDGDFVCCLDYNVCLNT